MISKQDLQTIAEERLKDAETLVAANRFDGAVYVGGYVVEIALKVRICTTLDWSDFPQSTNEFRSYQSFRTHDLEVLLHLSGVEQLIKTQYLTEWLDVVEWNPEARYRVAGSVSQSDAQNFISDVRTLLGVL